MTDQPRAFTASVEVQYTDELRATRAQTDAEIREEYFHRKMSEADIAYHRVRESQTARNWQRNAMRDAVNAVIIDAENASYRGFTDPDGDTSEMIDLDLEGATITVSLTDFVATATLTLADPQ